MAPTTNGSISAQFEQQQREVVNTFARAAVAMRDAARVAEEFSNWFARVNNMKDIPPPPPSSFASAPSPSSDVAVGSKKRKADKEPSPPLDEGGKKKRPTKEKKPRDKDAPRRPPSAYILFQNEVRKEIKNEHPDMPHIDLLKEVSKLWSTVSNEEKEMYIERHDALKSKYDEEKAAYDAKNGIVPDEKKDARSRKTTKKVATITPPKGITSTASRTKRAASDDSDRVSPQDEEEDEPEPEEAEPEAEMTEEDDEEEEEGEAGKGAGDSEVESELESEPEPPKKKTKVDDVQSNSRKNPSAAKEKEKDKKTKKDDKHFEEEKKRKKY